MENFPPILVEQIFDELSICDAINASYVSRQWHAMLTRYLYSTFNVNRYLSFFPDPASLLKVLRYTQAVLGGLRAFGYFVPSCRVHIYNRDPWHILVSQRYEDTIHDELLRQGFISSPKPKKIQKLPINRYLSNKTNDKDPFEVLVVVLTGSRDINSYAAMRLFNSSALRNCITGWGAVSLDWKWTFEKRGWIIYHRGSVPRDQQKGFVNSCVDMGIRLEERCTLSQLELDRPFVMYFPSAGGNKGHAFLEKWQLEDEMEEVRESFDCKYHTKLLSEIDLSQSELQDVVTVPVAQYKTLLQVAYKARDSRLI